MEIMKMTKKDNEKLEIRMEYHEIIFNSFRINILDAEKEIKRCINNIRRYAENNDTTSLLVASDELRHYLKEKDVFQKLLHDLENKSREFRTDLDNEDYLNKKYSFDGISDVNFGDIQRMLQQELTRRINKSKENK